MNKTKMKYKGTSAIFPTPFARFENSYMAEPNTGCWLWLLYCNADGYGCFRIGGERTVLAHRYSYRMFKGIFDDSLCLCHRCDTPSCVNPDHLFLGTRADNAADRDKKNRVQKGHKHVRTHLDNIHIKVIREAVALGFRREDIRRYFKISKTGLQNIITRHTWKHI